MSAPHIRTALIGLILFVAVAAVGATGGTTMTREERLAFLQNARVVSSHDIGKGITRPVRVTLSDGTTTHDAGFSAVDEHESIVRYIGGAEVDALMARRDATVGLIERQVAARGEAQVLY